MAVSLTEWPGNLMNVVDEPYWCIKTNISACDWSSEQQNYFMERCSNIFDPALSIALKGFYKKQWVYDYEYYSRTVVPPIMCAIGMICHPLTIITLFRPAFRTSTFLYMRIVAILELLHTIMITLLYSCDNSKSIQNSNFCSNYKSIVESGPISTSKLFATTLTIFLAFERLVAIVLPKFFTKICNKRFVGFACFCSLVTACLPMTQLAKKNFIWTYKDGWWTMSTNSRTAFRQQLIYEKYVSPVHLSILAVEAAAIILLNLVSAIGLHRRQQRMSKMVGAESAQKDLQQMKRLWQFQGSEALVMFFDLLCQMMMNVYDWDFKFNINCDYEEQLRNLRFYEFDQWSGFFNAGSKTANHFSIFFLFLAFNKLFRSEFVKMFKSGYNCIAKRGRHTATVATISTGLDKSKSKQMEMSTMITRNQASEVSTARQLSELQ